MSDVALVDRAVLDALQADAPLAALLPDGVWFGEARQGLTAFVVVWAPDVRDVAQFGRPGQRTAYLDCAYWIRAATQDTTPGRANDAAARIDALLVDVPLVVAGFGWLSTARVERLAPPPQVDAVDASIRWQMRGGRYRVLVAPHA
jgi:hypothetical protein